VLDMVRLSDIDSLRERSNPAKICRAKAAHADAQRQKSIRSRNDNTGSKSQWFVVAGCALVLASRGDHKSSLSAYIMHKDTRIQPV
jgi:hypothetical protein